MRQVPSRLRSSAIFLALFVLIPLSSFAQTRTTWSTAADIRAGARGAMVGTVNEILANSFTLVPDRDRFDTPVRVTADTIVTRYLGFGDTSAGEIFTGASGFSKLRVGDRVEVRGVGDTRNTIAAEEVLLLGRSVAPREGTSTTPRASSVEGIVRSVSSTENRLVVETDRREMYTILGTSSTPVYYQGNAYRIRNIEVGDRVRVEIESSTREGIRARLIDVLEDATPDDEFGREGRRTVTAILGRVTRIDSRDQTFRLETDRGREVRVDARFAYDRAGNRFRLSDLQVGDRLEVSGQFDTADSFRADTIRFRSELDRDEDEGYPEDDRDDYTGYSAVTISGTLEEPFADNLIVVRDASRDRYRILVDRDFVVRNRAGGYIRASQLREGDRLEVRAFRDRAGRYIAQTIRVR